MSVFKRVLAAGIVLTLLFSQGAIIFAQDAVADSQIADAVQYNTTITDLRTNYLSNPIGIECSDIVFGWQIESNLIGQKQVAYEISVYDTSSSNRTLWTSGRVESGVSVGIAYDGPTLSHATRYEWDVSIWDALGAVHKSGAAYFETGISHAQEWMDVPFIAMGSASASAPIFRTEKALSDNVKSARLYITALGVYEAYINNQRVAQIEDDGTETYHHMNPGYYDSATPYLRYHTYDVTSYLQKNDAVALSVLAGTGWYGGMGSKTGTPAIKAMLVINYNNGSTDTVSTNAVSWKATLDGPVTANSIYHGETYDARKETVLGDYKSPGYNDAGWDNVSERSYANSIDAQPGMTGKLLYDWEIDPVSVTLYTDSLDNPESPFDGGEILVDEYYAYEQPNDPLYANGSVHVVRGGSLFGSGVSLAAGQTMIVDLGQNSAGVPSLSFSAPVGTQVKMRFAEVLNDGSQVFTGTYSGDARLGNDALYAADGPKGSLYLKSLRNAEATGYYIFAGNGVESYTPKLTFYGYQYIELTADEDMTVHSASTIPTSSISEQVGMIETNNADVNQFYSNTVWGQLSNYFTIPTDCPQRDEREPWTGDALVFAKSGLYHFDAAAFMNGYQQILEGITQEYGFVGRVTPGAAIGSLGALGTYELYATGWSDIATHYPWTIYTQTGDITVLERNWDSMVAYQAYLQENERKPDLGYTKGTGTGFGSMAVMAFGDWLAYQGSGVEIIADAYYAYVTKTLADAALQLGKEAEAAAYAEKVEAIKTAFLEEHVETLADGGIVIRSDLGTASASGKGGVMEPNSQTALLWMIKLGIYEDEAMCRQLVEMLINNIQNKNPDPDSIRAEAPENSLATGFHGTYIIAPVVTEAGYPSVSYDLLLQDGLPSWLGTVKQGATTVWERWNSYHEDHGFGHQEMNSFNHFSLGAVTEWMYEYMLGISADAARGGFKHIVLQPTVDTGEKYNNQDRINWVRGSYKSHYGPIAAEWASDSGEISTYRVTIPANTSATLYLPVEASAVDGFENIPGVTINSENPTTVHNGQHVAEFELAAGGYNFENIGGKLVVTLQSGYVYADFGDDYYVSPTSVVVEVGAIETILINLGTKAVYATIESNPPENGEETIVTIDPESVSDASAMVNVKGVAEGTAELTVTWYALPDGVDSLDDITVLRSDAQVLYDPAGNAAHSSGDNEAGEAGNQDLEGEDPGDDPINEHQDNDTQHDASFEENREHDIEAETDIATTDRTAQDAVYYQLTGSQATELDSGDDEDGNDEDNQSLTQREEDHRGETSEDDAFFAGGPPVSVAAPVQYDVSELVKLDTATVTVSVVDQAEYVQVVFENDGDAYHIVDRVAAGASIGRASWPDNPTKTGYSFTGWWTAGGTQYTHDTVVGDGVDSGVLKLYAGWQPISTTTPGGGSRSSGGGNGGSSGGPNTNTVPTWVTGAVTGAIADLTEAAALTAVDAALGSAATSVRFQNPGKILLSTMQAMAARAGENALVIHADSLNGNAVEVRLYFELEKATMDINLAASTSNARATALKSLFEKWFANKFMVVSLEHEGAFGQSVEVAVRLSVDLSSKEEFVLYSYQPATNTYTKLPTQSYRLDRNGYLHFTVTGGGDYVISSGKLMSK